MKLLLLNGAYMKYLNTTTLFWYYTDYHTILSISEGALNSTRFLYKRLTMALIVWHI